MKKAAIAAGWFVAATLCAAPAAASERQEVEALRAATLNLIRMLVAEGVLSQDKAEALLRQAEAGVPPPGAPARPAVRVPFVPEVVRQELRNQIREEVIAQARAERWAEPNTFPSWANRFTLEGDVRLRLQQDNLDPANAPPLAFPTQNLANTQEDRTRLRVRARVGFRVAVSEEVEAGVQFGTGTVGSTGSPNSTTNTLGNYLNREAAGIDLAFVAYTPREWLRLVGGRFRNPFLHSEMTWAPDLNFDGAAVTLRPQITSDLRAFLTLGAFPLREFEPAANNRTRRNKWLYGYQGGFEFRSANDSTLRLGAAYYDYRNIEGIPNVDATGLFDWSAPQFRQKGNSYFNIAFAGQPNLFALASQFRILNLTGELDLAHFEPVRVSLLADYAANLGFDRDEIQRRTNNLANVANAQANAFHLRLQAGHRRIERWGDWFLSGGYMRLGSDSVLDAFTQGDFNLGGTNARGYILSGGFGIARNTWLSLRYSSANAIQGPPLGIDVLQLDFNTRF